MFSLLRSATAALALSLATIAGVSAACPDEYAMGAPPELLNERMSERTNALCFEEMAVLHSGLTRTPLYAAEYLDRQQILEAWEIERDDSFHAEDALPEEYRSELEDYRGSGWDRGHLAPAADFPTASSQSESFSMANIIPQHPGNNREIWADIERTVRAWALESGEVYVVTGASFIGADLQALNERVVIPTHVWKAVYDPVAGMAGAYWTPNVDDAGWTEISIAHLRETAEIDPFPGLPEEMKASTHDLPDPMDYIDRQGFYAVSGPADGSAGVSPEAISTENTGNVADDALSAIRDVLRLLK
ncbi:DNA/RNA non-specific endonuclease [Inquilinus sp. CAU 1745]|uniref:DNA/RNA non-specific endonuclease n=1 Tax=Inquilinus sp. CAU 1745 TaxID=3140369 RepID=UPI00325A6376